MKDILLFMEMTDKKSLSFGALFCHETLSRSHQCSFFCLSHFHFFCHFVVLIFILFILFFHLLIFLLLLFHYLLLPHFLYFNVTHSQSLHCGSLSSRSEEVLNALAAVMPEIIGGSADLTGSNLTNLKVPDFLFFLLDVYVIGTGLIDSVSNLSFSASIEHNTATTFTPSFSQFSRYSSLVYLFSSLGLLPLNTYHV